MMLATSSHTKARSHSSDAGCYNTNPTESPLNYSYDLERAASSEAELPSYEYHADENNGSNDNTLPPHTNLNQQQHYHSTTTKQPHHYQQQTFSRLKSDSSQQTVTTSTTTSKRLQTIESGISLADSAGGQHGVTLSPRPPLHPTNSSSFSSVGSGGPPLLPNVPNVGTIDKPDVIQQRDVTNGSHQSQYSTISYYSVDAGKHGFLTNASYVSQDSDNDSAGDANSANGSLVFKYQPGQETPPAEYALPAAILGVYGEQYDVEEGNNKIRVPSSSSMDGAPMHWNHRSSSEFTNGSQSSIFFTHSEDSSDPGSPHMDKNVTAKDGNANKAPRGSPQSKNNDASSRRVPSNTSLVTRPPSHGGPPEVTRILPYHERKRLMELEEEEKKRKKSQKMTNKARSNKVKNKVGFREDAETTPLTGKQRGAATNGYGSSSTSTTANSSENKEEQQQQSSNNNNGWFGQLVSIVTGKQSEDEERDEQRIQDETKSFRDRGQAFLKQTEEERLKLKEEKRLEELNNVTVPVTNQSFGGHNRAKMSSMSAALDSIASCDTDEEEDSSDEESGSYFYRDEEEQARPQAAARVWKYGEPPINTSNTTTAPNKNATMSKHDRIMRRERLLQEEYEYRLRSLRKENENLSRKFRIFVLVTVALIFAGALSFAFVVCVRMLMSL